MFVYAFYVVHHSSTLPYFSLKPPNRILVWQISPLDQWPISDICVSRWVGGWGRKRNREGQTDRQSMLDTQQGVGCLPSLAAFFLLGRVSVNLDLVHFKSGSWVTQWWVSVCLPYPCLLLSQVKRLDLVSLIILYMFKHVIAGKNRWPVVPRCAWKMLVYSYKQNVESFRFDTYAVRRVT